jgi:hypothetical protein
MTGIAAHWAILHGIPTIAAGFNGIVAIGWAAAVQNST